MRVRVLIPTPLRAYTGGVKTIELNEKTVAEVLQRLVKQFPDLKPHLFNEDGSIRPFINIFINDDDIRHREGLHTPVKDGDVISLIPSIAGG